MLTVASFGQLEPSSGMKEKKTLKTNCKIKGNTLLWCKYNWAGGLKLN